MYHINRPKVSFRIKTGTSAAVSRFMLVVLSCFWCGCRKYFYHPPDTEQSQWNHIGCCPSLTANPGSKSYQCLHRFLVQVQWCGDPLCWSWIPRVEDRRKLWYQHQQPQGSDRQPWRFWGFHHLHQAQGWTKEFLPQILVLSVEFCFSLIRYSYAISKFIACFQLTIPATSPACH